MNRSAKNSVVGGSGSGEFPGSGGFEETLRLIAHAAAPAGLEERVQAGLLAAPRASSPRARILAWPVARRMDSAWMRSAAAAAIVAIVIGGGWGVYSRVQPGQAARVITVSPHVSAQGGFSSAGAKRTPQTLVGPVAEPVTAAPLTAKTGTQPTVKTPIHPVKTATAKKTLDQPVAPTAK
jgi:hypothetical protein